MAVDPKISCVAVFGGSGFLGREIVKRLATKGIATRVAVRHPEAVSIEATSAGLGNIQAIYTDVRDDTSVGFALKECDAVVNAVGLYTEHGAENFEAVHELGAVNVAHHSAISGIERLVHISGIGADLNSPSRYIRARAKGETLVADILPNATILRPSVLFGQGDRFVNAIERATRYSPVMPLFGSGRTKLQPIYVGDVANATFRALSRPDTLGNVYELGGPQAYAYRELIDIVLRHYQRRRLLLPVPYQVWKLLASIASILPSPPLTPAQVTLMERDNVVATGALKLQDLEISPTPLEKILTTYRNPAAS